MCPTHDVATHGSAAPDCTTPSWRAYGGAIERMYQRADTFVGDVLSRLEPGTAVDDRVGPWLPLLPMVRQPQHVARRERLHGPSGTGAWREEARRSLWWRDLLGECRLVSKTRLRDGTGPDLCQLERREGQGIVNPGPEPQGPMDSMVTDWGRCRILATARAWCATSTNAATFIKPPFFDVAAELQVGFETGGSNVVADGTGRHSAASDRAQHEEVVRRPRVV